MTSTAANGKSDKLLQQQNGAPNPNGAAANGVTSTTTEVNASFLRAARAGNLDKVLEYLNQNIDINVSNSNGLNALHLASKEGHVHVVKELLERSANVNAATKKGNTALHIASLAGQFDVVELLVKFGANVDCRSQNGFTPLYMAAQENHIEVVKFLLANNANQSLATEDGFTPLAVALQQGHEKVVAILLENDSRGKIRLPALHIAAKKNDVKAAALLLNNDPNMDLSPEAGKSGFTPLHIAAHYGNVEIAKFLVTKGADVNFEARQNITPLHVATKWGKVNSVNLLLDSGAKIDVKTRDGLTPLHCAARSGHDQVVELLIARQAPINAKTKNGLTALHMAAQGDHVEAARILLYHSPKLVDQTTCDFLTALHVAAHCGHVKIAKLLLDHKADVNARALNGFTPLHIACKKNRIKVIELLIKHGAFKEATTESGLTPLHVASFMGCMNVVVFLIQHGAQPNVPTIRGETPLHLATRANQTDIVRILLRHGAAVNAEAKEKQTPLHIATRLGNTDIIALLLRHGAAVDAATSDGYTALHIASKEGQEEVASILFESGASLNVTTKKGFTPLHIAAKYGNIKVASLLLQRKALPDVQGKNGLTPLHVATHYNRPSVAHLLLEHGASPHIVAKNGYSALHIAAKKNQMDIATTLLEYSAKTNCESNAGFTPLHLACQEGHLDMSSLLLDHAADASAASRNGLTPLHLCAQEDKVNCAAVLVKAGAPIDPQTKAGYTPLHVACHFGQINMVKFLLQHHADVNIITKHGFTSLHCAAQQGHVLIVKLLLEHGASPDITNNNGQTPLAIAQRLGYISVIEELKLVTQTTLVSTTIKTTEEKYKVQTPETMQETFMSDSEDELGDEGMFNAADYTTYLTDEAHLHNAADESIALTPKTPKREEAAKLESVQIGDQQSPTIQQTPPSHQTVAPPTTAATTTATTTSTSKTTPTYADQQQSILLHQQQLQQTPVSAASEKRAGRRTDGHTVGSVANMSMAESMDGSYYNGYDTTKHSAMIETDNIPLEARPKSAGFLISFMVDARGGAMKGCRHSGVRVIIPPKRASMPTRITCRFVRKEKLTVSPPLNESEALAARVLEMGPHGCKFLGPVVLEIPHYASLRNREREIVILRSDSGEKWYEHPIIATEQAIEEALGCTLELAAANAIQSAADAQADAQSAQHHHDDLQSAKLRITRIITNDFPKYFALISRVRHETHAVSEVGGVISSTIVPKAQAVFPEKALQKKIKISLQAMPIPTELVVKMFGNRVAVSPIVTIEPRRRKFHKAITLTIPLPKSPLKGMLNSYSHTNESFSLRLLCSITGGLAPAQWEDITGHTPLSYIDECVSFTTTVSARFWLMDCQAVSEATKMATELYREAIAVPYMARFIVYAKRHEFNESRLRVYCITDDKEEKVLETREQFVTVAKSKEVEVLGDRVQWLEMGGNITPVESNKQSGDQLNMLFAAFYENRLPFTVRIKDVDHSPATGRLVFLKDAKNAPLKSDLRSPPVCTLDIQLPGYDRDAIEHDEARRRQTLSRSGGAIQFTFLNGSGQLSQSGTNLTQPSLDFNLRLLANDLNNSDRLPPFDWTRLAQRLDVSPDEIEALKTSSAGASIFQQSPSNLTYDMLVHWQNKYNNMVADQLQAAVDSGAPSTSVPAPAGEQLLSALRDLQVDEEIIQRNISSSFVTSGGPQSASRTQQQSSSLSAENILSVEKSLAKLNVNLNELSKKDEPTTDSSLKARKSLLGANYEEKDMTKESESADDYSENEDSQQKVSTIQSSKIEENIVTTTIFGEERIHHEPTGLVSETIVDSVIEARNGDNFKQHFEDRTEVKYEEPDASRTAYYDNDDYDEKQQQLEQQNRTDLEEKSALEQDPEYFSKVNAEYEAIKRNVMAKQQPGGGDYDNLQNYRNELLDNVPPSLPLQKIVNPQLASMASAQLTSSFYDNLNEAVAQANQQQAQNTAAAQQQPPLYDNLVPIDVEKPAAQEPVVYKMDELVNEGAPELSHDMTRSELDELIDKINDMQTLSRDEYPTTTSTGNLAGAGAADTSNLSNLSSNSSINSLNRIEEYAKSVSEKYSPSLAQQKGDVSETEAETSQILNDIIQQVMTAQEQVKKLDEQASDAPACPLVGGFTWENLVSPPPPPSQIEQQQIEAPPQEQQEEISSELDKNFTWETLAQSSSSTTQPSDNNLDSSKGLIKEEEKEDEKHDVEKDLIKKPKEEEEHLVEQEEEKKPDERPELVGQDESAVVEKPSQHEAYEDEQGSEYYDRDQELDVEVNYQIDMDSGPISSTTTTKIGEASSYRRPSDLKDLDLDFSTTNEAMETIEKQSPIIERELHTTEQQLENLRSRLAMSESVSAVTQSVLESIRREYNLPESKDTEEEEAVNYSSSNDDAPIDYYKEKEEEQGADESLVTSSSGNEAEVEVLKQETTQIISDVNRDMQEKLEQIEGKIREKQVHDVIEKFAKESQSQIEKIMMIQSLEEPDEVEEEPLVPVHSSGSGDESSKAQDEIISGARKLSLSQTRLIEEGASESDSNVENREEQPEMSRKLSLSQTQLIEDASESGEDIPIKPPLSPKSPKTLSIQETSSTLTPAVRKLSISQTRLIEEEEEEEASESDVIEQHEHKIEDIQPAENIIEDNSSEKPYDQFNMLSKSRQYQTFESSSSTNSELNKQEDFKQRHKRDDDDDNDDDEFGGGGGSRIAASLATSKIEEIEEKTQLIEDTEEVKIEEPLPAATISYSSGEVSSESIGETAAAVTEPTRFLAVASSGIKESESHEFLLEDAKQEEDDELETSVSLERFDMSSTSSKNHLEPASSRTLDGSNEDVSVTTVIERRRSSDQEKETKKKKTQKESSTEISSEAYETDEENHPHVPTTTIEAATLLSSSDQEEEAEKEAGNRSGGSSENLEVTVDLITEEPLIQVEKQQQPETARSSLYLDLDTTNVNKSESREPLIGAAAEPPVIEELTLEEEGPGRDDYPNDSPPVMYENSSCGASMTSCSTMSEENLIKSNTSAQAESDSNIDQQFSKSLTYLESLVVPSSTGDLLIENKSGGSELFFEEKDDKEPDDFGGSSGEDLYPDKNIKRNSQSLTFTKSGAVQRPMSFTVRPSQEIDDNHQMLKSSELFQLEQLQQEQQTPTPVENIAGDFFDKRITSSNEPSIDRLTSTSDAGGNVALRDSIGREISNESLESYAGIKSENEELEAKAAFATALLFSSTIKSQSSDEVKSVTSAHQTSKHTDEEGDVPIEEEAQTSIQDATPRSFTKYITLKKDSNEDIFSEQSKDDEFVKESEEESKLEQQGIDNPCFDATTDQSHDEEEKSSSTESVIINHDYDDSEDQQRMKIKIIQSSLPSKSIPPAAATTSQELIEEEEGEEFEPPVTSDIEEQVDIDDRELKTGISLLTERIEPSDSDFMINQPEPSKPLEEEIIRTKDGVVLDDQAFLVCTPTPSNLTPQIEKDIGVELSHLDEQTEELAAKLIVETAIEKSVEKVIREQEERDEELAKEEEIIQRSRKSSIITDEHELDLLKEEYEIVEEIKPNESAEARELIEAFEESLREQDYVVLGQSEVVLEPSEPPLLAESPLVEVKSPIKRDEETLFSEIESELKDIRESKQQMKENDQEELADQQELKSERLELAKSIVDKTISKSIELLTVDKPEELEAITETSSETENEKIKEVQVAQEETKSIVAPKIDVISTQDDDEVEEKAKELVDKVLSISIEKLTDESTASSQKPAPQQQSPSSGSIIKTSTISPTSGGNYGSYSPKEVRFSNLVSTDSVISDHDVKDDFFENFDEKFSKHFDLIAGDGSLLIDVEQKARNDLIQTDQFSNLQSLILANNCENTFIKMNQKQKSEEEAAAHAAIEPVADVSETRIQEESSPKLVEEAKSFVDNVIERALEKVSIVISDEEDGDDETKKKKRAKKQDDDDHQEAKFKGGKDDDDDDNNDDKRGPDFGPSGEAIEKREESQTVSSQESTQYQSSEQKDQEQEHHDTEVVIESDEVQNQYEPNQPTEENLEQFDQVIEPTVQITYDLTTEDNQTDSEPESEMIDYNTTLERTEIEKSNIEENKVVDELIDNNPPKPLLTSSFMDDKLPSETSKLSPDEDDDDEDRLSSKTLDLAANQQFDLDRTLSENNTTDELFKIKSSSSTSSYFTAVSSIPKQQPQQQEGEEDKDKSAHEFSIRTSGSSNYMTAAEEIRSDQNMSTSESFYSAYSSVPKHKSSSSSQHSESNQQQHQATGNSSFASLNSSYSTLNDNQLSGNLSGNLTDFDSSDEIEFQQNASQSSQEDPTATSLGQFNVEMFLKNMQPLVNRSNSQEDENRENSSSKSSHSTLTDDKKQAVEETVAIKTPSPSQEDFATLIASRGAEITEQKKESSTNVSPDLEMKISPTNQDPTILQHVHQQLHSSSSSSLSSSTSSLLAKNQLAKTQTEGNSQSFDLEHSLLYKNGNGDNISCTSSVLEFEKLEAQCNLEEDLGITSELDIKPGVVRIKRPRDNMGMAELTEEVDLYGSSTSSTTSGVATLVDDDQAEGNMSDSEDDYSRNLIISHDLNTIYESQERETGSSNDEDSMSNNAASALVKEPSPRESLEDLEKRRDSGASKASDKSDPGSPSSTSKPNPTLEPPNKSQLSSRSNSSSSVRSTDSFENELKQKFKINEESFFARRKREKEKKPSPKSLEVAPQTSAAASSSQSSTQQQQELKSPPENRLDSGQSSMTTSFMSSASQLQSPANESSSSSHLSDRRLLSNDSFLTTSYMSDLNQQQQQNEPTSSSSSSQAETLQPGGSSRGGVKKSGRLSRASSSASSSSSTSLNDSSTRYSINSSIITVLSNQLNTTVQPLTGEDLPSFKKKSPSPSPLSYKYESASCKMSPTQTTEKVVTSASASNISSQQMASSSADGTTTPTKQPSPKLKKQVVPPPPDNSKSLSKSHSHHSSDCYCGKHAESDKSKAKTSKSFTSETTHSASKKN